MSEPIRPSAIPQAMAVDGETAGATFATGVPPLSPLRQLLRAALSLGMLNIASMGVTFVVGVLLARQLGPAGYGTYALAMAVTAFAGMITEFGLPALTMREFGAAGAHNDWRHAKGLLHWSDRAILFLSAVMLGLVILVGTFIGAGDRSIFVQTLGWSVLLIPIVALSKLRGLALLSLGKTVRGQFPVLVLRPGLFACGLALAWLVLGVVPSPVNAMMVQVAAAGVSLAIVAWFFRISRSAAYITSGRVNAWRNWIATSLPMGATEGLRLLQGQLALLLLGILGSADAAGIYRVADAAMAVCAVAASILGTATAPTFAQLFVKRELSLLSEIAVITSCATFAGTFLLGLPVVLGGEWVFATVFGAKFAPASQVFLVLWLANLAAATMGAVTTYANMTGGERLVAIGTAISVVTSCAVAASLIPSMREIGAAIGTGAGLVAWNLFVLMRVKRRDGVAMSAFGFKSSYVTRAVAVIRDRMGAVRNGL